MKVMSVRSTQASTAQPPNKEPPSNSTQGVRPSTSKSSGSYFCYRCGEDGHIATTCTAPENSQKVIQKLIRARGSKSQPKEPDTSSEGIEQDALAHKSSVKINMVNKQIGGSKMCITVK